MFSSGNCKWRSARHVMVFGYEHYEVFIVSDQELSIGRERFIIGAGDKSGMEDAIMNRKDFLAGVGRACACSCACALAAILSPANAQDIKEGAENNPETKSVKKPRSEERMDFTERWAVRFFSVLDDNLDAPTRRKIMTANGRACLLSWQKSTNQNLRTEAMTLEDFSKQLKEKASTDYQIDGHTLYFQYPSAGSSSSRRHCLCPMVETKPAGLSPTFCLCSLGYVQEMHEQIFKRRVEVELLSSVLRGDPECRFKITLP
jgi:hypothetical protein